MIEKINPNFDEDQKSFWMNFDDLIDNFEFCTITHTQAWHEL